MPAVQIVHQLKIKKMAENMQRQNFAQPNREWDENTNSSNAGNEGGNYNESETQDWKHQNRSNQWGNYGGRNQENYQGTNYGEQGSYYGRGRYQYGSSSPVYAGRRENYEPGSTPQYGSRPGQSGTDFYPGSEYGNPRQRGNQYGNPGYGQGGTPYSNPGYGQNGPQYGNPGYEQGGSQYGNPGYEQGGTQYSNQRYGQGGMQYGTGWGQNPSQYGNGSYGNTNTQRGKGPKGYQRSDDRIKEDINDRLTDDHHLDASEIEVHVANGEVKLSGTVENRESKRRAEDLVEAISGVSNVENSIRVKQDKYQDKNYINTGSSAMKPANTAFGHDDAKNNDKTKRANSMA